MSRESITYELMRHIDWASDLTHTAANSLSDDDFKECLLDIDNQLYDMHNQISEYLEEW